MELSEQAKAKRWSDMEVVVRNADYFAYLRIASRGAFLLIKSMFEKFNPRQRAALIALLFVLGGAIIGTLLYFQQWGLALVIMFILGWAVGEIARS